MILNYFSYIYIYINHIFHIYIYTIFIFSCYYHCFSTICFLDYYYYYFSLGHAEGHAQGASSVSGMETASEMHQFVGPMWLMQFGGVRLVSSGFKVRRLMLLELFRCSLVLSL